MSVTKGDFPGLEDYVVEGDRAKTLEVMRSGLAAFVRLRNEAWSFRQQWGAGEEDVGDYGDKIILLERAIEKLGG
jgi:hypothetical protein